MSFFIPNGTLIPSDALISNSKSNSLYSGNLILSPYSSTSDVINPISGMIIFNTTTKLINYYNGTSWEENINPWTQLGSKLVGTGAIGEARQSFSVSISSDGNTFAIGGYQDNGNVGAVWIFTKSGNIWSQQGAKLVGTGATGSARQGWSVSLSSDGNTLAVGGQQDNGNIGAVWIFIRSGNIWSQQGSKLVGTGATGSSRQGWSVFLSSDGNTLAVGGPQDNGNIGAVWIYTRSGNVWSQEGSKLVGTGVIGSPRQGNSISLSSNGNTLAVGGQQDNAFVGATWIYTRSGNIWSQQGSKLVGSGFVDQSLQGSAVSLSSNGDTLAVGGNGDDTLLGATWVFIRSGNVWSQQGSKLIGTNYIGTEIFQGNSVSLSSNGNILTIGGNGDDSNIGAVWTFIRSGNVWSQYEEKIVGTGFVDQPLQGTSNSISGDGKTLIVGGQGDDNTTGAVWIFTR